MASPPSAPDYLPRNPSYDETGLQTGNHPEAPSDSRDDDQPPSLNDEPRDEPIDEQKDERLNQREVTDPVTHIPITIHDATDTELERIPPPPATPQLQPEDEGERKEDSDQRHDEMNTLVEHETDGRWVDVEEREQKSRLRSALVAGAAGAAAAAAMFIWAVLVVRGSSRGMFIVHCTLATVACVLLGAGAGRVVWTYAAVGKEVDTDALVAQVFSPRTRNVLF